LSALHAGAAELMGAFSDELIGSGLATELIVDELIVDELIVDELIIDELIESTFVWSAFFRLVVGRFLLFVDEDETTVEIGAAVICVGSLVRCGNELVV